MNDDYNIILVHGNLFTIFQGNISINIPYIFLTFRHINIILCFLKCDLSKTEKKKKLINISGVMQYILTGLYSALFLKNPTGIQFL